MSKECTEYDVRVVLYDSARDGRHIAHILFFNDSELLLESKRVKLSREGTKVYFSDGEHIKDSVKLSGRDTNILQLYAYYGLVKDMEGLYDLKFDQSKNAYYIDNAEKLADYDHEVKKLGTKQLNHNNGVREKREDIIVDVALKDSAKKIVNAKNVEKQEDARVVVVNALIALLKTQVVGNKDALSTIETLEKYL